MPGRMEPLGPAANAARGDLSRELPQLGIVLGTEIVLQQSLVLAGAEGALHHIVAELELRVGLAAGGTQEGGFASSRGLRRLLAARSRFTRAVRGWLGLRRALGARH